MLVNEMELPKTCETEFDDPDNLLSFTLIISPDEGLCSTKEENLNAFHSRAQLYPGAPQGKVQGHGVSSQHRSGGQCLPRYFRGRLDMENITWKPIIGGFTVLVLVTSHAPHAP